MQRCQMECAPFTVTVFEQGDEAGNRSFARRLGHGRDVRRRHRDRTQWMFDCN
jgi:hypothetical protein